MTYQIQEPEATSELTANASTWLQAYRDIADLIDGITDTDYRFHSVQLAIDRCEQRYHMKDWDGFQRAVMAVRLAVEGGSTPAPSLTQ